MLAKVNSSALVGLNAIPVEVEVDIAGQGLPSFTKVGTKYQSLSFKRIYDYLRGYNAKDNYGSSRAKMVEVLQLIF